MNWLLVERRKVISMQSLFPCWLIAFLLLVSYASSSQAKVPIIPAGQSFLCTPTHVWDGDGPIWCKEGPRVRLAGISAREMDGTCKKYHPCPQTNGVAARDFLVQLLGVPTRIGKHGHILITGPTLKCISEGSAGRTRTAAWCVSPKNGDINCAMTESGQALRWQKYWKRHRC